MFVIFTITCFLIANNSLAQTPSLETYKNPEHPVEVRVKDLLSRMTLEEKVDMVSGSEFSTKPNVRLGIPRIIMTDGPLGPSGNGRATNYSACINMAATWDNALIERVGKAIGEETRGLGYDMLLAPMINIARVPHGGRTFEVFGEDPYLMSRMAVAYIKGVQSKRVSTCTKVLACNNQEWNRFDVSVDVDERTLREIYLPAFKAAVKEGDTWAIMAAYNQCNGTYCCENKYLLTDILKNEWGFDGIALSDWGGVVSTINTANSGLDLEMPTGKYMGDKLLEAVKRGQVEESIINEKVRSILRVIFKLGLFNEQTKKNTTVIDTPEHRKLALEVAKKSIVLLKNENGILPLKEENIKSIAVIGPNADMAQMYGGGSGWLDSFYKISPLDGLLKKTGDKIVIKFERGLRPKPKKLQIIDSSMLIPPNAPTGEHGLLGEYYNNRNLEGEPALTRIDKQVDFDWKDLSPASGVINDEKFSVRWTGQLIAPGTGLYEIGVNADNGVRLIINGKYVVDSWTDADPDGLKSTTYYFKAGHKYDIEIQFYENRGWAMAIFGMAPYAGSDDTIEKAVKLTQESEVAIICAGLDKFMEGEAKDRDKLELPDDQVKLIKAVAAVNTNTIVVLYNATPIIMNEWIDDVSAIIEAFYPGQEGGTALGDILFGDVNPSGKLPLTFLKSWKDSPVYNTYPGTKTIANYSEGIFVGYRHYDKYNIKPLFPFGYGLSYTTFEYSNIEIEPKTIGQDEIVSIKMTVKNTGPVAGDEIVQLYVRDIKSSVEREDKALKGFKRISLKSGESKTVTFKLDDSALAFYDVKTKQWVAEPGKFEILIGSSSRDVRLKDIFELR